MLKQREYLLLEAIAEDKAATQANLAAQLEMAVGSVNWYIKRLIDRGYLQAQRMDRTRLQYLVTGEGMRALQRNAARYAKDSLKLYDQLRQQAKSLIAEIRARGIESVFVDSGDAALDIFRLSCLEAGAPRLDKKPGRYVVRVRNGEYRLERVAPVGNGAKKIARGMNS